MLILVGERANASPLSVPTDDSWCTIRGLMRHGALRWGRSRERLLSLGLRWDVALNLLPAAPTKRATWDVEDRRRASWVAQGVADVAHEAIRAGVTKRGVTLVLLGARACEAFGVPFEPCRVRRLRSSTLTLREHKPIQYMASAHPSGLCRWWNDPENVDSARRTFAQVRLESAEVDGGVAADWPVITLLPEHKWLEVAQTVDEKRGRYEIGDTDE